MDRTEAICPACGSSHVVPVVWDLSGSEFAELEWEDGVTLAGENDPDWHCRACGYEWIEPTNTTWPA